MPEPKADIVKIGTVGRDCFGNLTLPRDWVFDGRGVVSATSVDAESGEIFYGGWTLAELDDIATHCRAV